MHPNRQASSGGQHYADVEKQPSGYDTNVHYPSFPNQQQHPSAPLFGKGAQADQTLPQYYNNNNTSAAPPQQQQYTQYQYPTQPPAPAYQPPQYVPPRHSRDYRERGCIGSTLKLVVFHFFNALLGIVGFVLIISGVHISIGLLPLCCFGIVVFRGVLCLVGVLAKADVKLYNYISPPSEHVYVDIPQQLRFLGVAGERLSPKLFSFSPLAIAAVLYFCTIKFAVGMLSMAVVALNVGLLGALGTALSDNDLVQDSYNIQIGDRKIDARKNLLEFALVWVCMFVISIALMHLVAKVSRASTRFFCCEKFSTYRYVNTVQYAQPVVQVPVNAIYGTY